MYFQAGFAVSAFPLACGGRGGRHLPECSGQPPWGLQSVQGMGAALQASGLAPAKGAGGHTTAQGLGMIPRAELTCSSSCAVLIPFASWLVDFYFYFLIP